MHENLQVNFKVKKEKAYVRSLVLLKVIFMITLRALLTSSSSFYPCIIYPILLNIFKTCLWLLGEIFHPVLCVLLLNFRGKIPNVREEDIFELLLSNVKLENFPVRS